MARYIHEQTVHPLCMAGGVASTASQRAPDRETPFKELFVQRRPRSGGSVGVAHYVYNTLGKQPRGPAWTHAYLGPEYDDAEIRRTWTAPEPRTACSPTAIVRETARLMPTHVIGCSRAHGVRAPRLGGAILADPRGPRSHTLK